MKKTLSLFLSLAILFIFIECASAMTMLDFEDLSGSANMESSYHGLSWDTKWIHYDNCPSNPGSYLYFSYHPMEGAWIDFGDLTNFYGSYVSFSPAMSSKLYEVHWEGYVNGIKLYESIHRQNRDGDGWIDVDWNVDLVKCVASWDNTGFCVDNIKYDSSPVPEPSTIFLLSIGLLGLVGIKSRKKKS